jgi:hypothetical protein
MCREVWARRKVLVYLQVYPSHPLLDVGVVERDRGGHPVGQSFVA